MPGDKAKDALQQREARVAKSVDFKDVHPGESHTRSVLMPSHWKVCSQQPAAGEPAVKDMTVTLSVVKNEEDCPGAVPPSPAARATEPASAAPTSTVAPAAPAAPAAPPAPAAPATHEPAPASTPPAPQPTPTQHQAAGCTTDSKGACIVRGRFCPSSAHGDTGTDAAGRTLTCEDKNGWRWE
ncbi:hypothetical protein ABZW03_04695 [Kitasatospora sp. NPDC004799]|uniref:hypothetical protein n=1 Tax=Kitasatospora sp. NPDC004799 TaxID=3154460 RepID=UPI0033A594E1